MFTRRQIKLLVYLLDSKTWSKTVELSALLNVGNKTVLKEIRLINEINSKELYIEFIRNKGFKITILSEELKNKIIQDSYETENLHSLNDNTSLFILYLLLQDKVVSMQTISDVFYMSKTSVAKEFEDVKRWIKRTKGLTLEKSRLGFKIEGEEKFKRLYLSTIINSEVLRQLDFKTYNYLIFKENIQGVKKILKDIFFTHRILLSDLDFIKVSKYIVISIMRSNSNKFLLDSTVLTDHSLYLMQLKDKVNSNLNYIFSNQELIEIKRLIDCYCWNRSVKAKEETRKIVQDKLEEINQHIGGRISISEEKTSEDILELLTLLKEKQKYGVTSLNLLNDEIIENHLLAAHYIYLIANQMLNITIDKEFSRAVLLMSIYIQNLNKKKHKVLLISRSNKEIIEYIKHQILFYFPDFHIDYFPQFYINNLDLDFLSFDIFLTTEEEVLIHYPYFELIDPISPVDKLFLINSNFHKLSKDNIKNEINSLSIKNISLNDKEEIDYFIGNIDNLITSETSKIFLSGNKLLICSIANGLKDEIIQYTLKKEILLENKFVQNIFHVNCSISCTDKVKFFEIVSQYIKLR